MFSKTDNNDRKLHRTARATLLAFVLVASLVAAPIGAGTASAQQMTDPLGICDSPAGVIFAQPCDDIDELETIDEEQSANAVRAELNVLAANQYESWEAYRINMENYIGDTGPVASLRAKEAIVDAYQNGSSATAADAAAGQAISDYYAVHQTNLIEHLNKDVAGFEYIKSVADSHPDIGAEFAYESATGHEWDHVRTWSGYGLKADNRSRTVGLVNDSSIEQISLAQKVEVRGSSSASSWNDHWHWPAIDDQLNDDNRFVLSGAGRTTSNLDGSWHSGQYRVSTPQGDTTLSDEIGLNLIEYRDVWDQIEDQHSAMISNYPEGFAEDVYDAFDSGQMTTDEFLGPEGLAFTMAGDTNAGESYHLATTSLLDLDRPSLNNTMVVEYDAATSRFWNDSADEFEYEYEQGTVEGVLFASLEDDLTINETYQIPENVSSAQVVSGNDTTHFHEGEFRVLEAYDSQGNQLQEVEWGAQQYDTYNASEFIEAMQNAQQDRIEIIDRTNGSDGGFAWPSLPSFGDALGSATDAIVLGAGALLAVAVFRNMGGGNNGPRHRY